MTKKKVWTTRDGTRIDIDRMTDAHLDNAIKLIERAVESKKEDQHMRALYDETAGLSFLGQIENEGYPAIFWDLKEEAEKRNKER